MTTHDHDELSRRADELQRVLEIHPADFDLQTRGRGFVEALMIHGRDDLAGLVSLLIDVALGDCPLHTSQREDPEVAALHEPGAPELVELRDGCVSTYVPTGPSPCFGTPETDGGADSAPRDADEAIPPARPAPVPPSHVWIGRSTRHDCFCLIGDDHVAAPRFEKDTT